MNTTLAIQDIQHRLNPIFVSSPVYRAILFGSYAKGKATDSSDVDIVIDSRGELLNIGFYGVLEDITQALGTRVDLLEISELQPGSPILDDIEREGIVLYEA